jgi:hypothetical protein
MNEAEMDELKRKSNKRLRKTNNAKPYSSDKKRCKSLPITSFMQKKEVGLKGNGNSSLLKKSYSTEERSIILYFYLLTF